MILQSKTLVYTSKGHRTISKQAARKITAQNERYLNHITLVQLLERHTYQTPKITAQNERYLNHISECSISESGSQEGEACLFTGTRV